MDESLIKLVDIKINSLKNKLEAKQFKVSVVENVPEMLALVKAIIPTDAKVGLGGSKTIEQSGLLKQLYETNVNLVDRYKKVKDKDERDDLLRESLLTDYFVTSTNAISMDGALYNIDGTGNRVAAMCFGPKNVLVICGINKITENEEEAITRVKNIASPANAIRLNKDTPCAKLGYCVNCNCADRICDCYVKIDRSHVKNRIHIIIVKEDLGF